MFNKILMMWVLILLMSSFVLALTEEQKIINDEQIERILSGDQDVDSVEVEVEVLNETTNQTETKTISKKWESTKVLELRKGRLYFLGFEFNPFVAGAILTALIFIVVLIIRSLTEPTGGV